MLLSNWFSICLSNVDRAKITVKWVHPKWTSWFMIIFNFTVLQDVSNCLIVVLPVIKKVRNFGSIWEPVVTLYNFQLIPLSRWLVDGWFPVVYVLLWESYWWRHLFEQDTLSHSLFFSLLEHYNSFGILLLSLLFNVIQHSLFILFLLLNTVIHLILLIVLKLVDDLVLNVWDDKFTSHSSHCCVEKQPVFTSQFLSFDLLLHLSQIFIFLFLLLL